MKGIIALLTGALFFVPALAPAQTASPAPSASTAPKVFNVTPAPSASPAPLDTPTLSVPDGWMPKDYTMNMGNFTLMKIWYAPGAGGDNIDLGYSPNPKAESLAQVVPVTRAILEKLTGAGVTDHAEKLCNGTADGWLFQSTLTMGAMKMIVNEVMLPSKHQVFAAAYTRILTHPADSAALKALDTLCVKAS